MWQLDGTIASWQSVQLTAQFDLLTPHLGVQVQQWQQLSITPDPVLQVDLQTRINVSDLDAYIREGDLIVQYPECPDTGYRLQLRWSTLCDSSIAAVELLVTMHTTRFSITSSLDVGNQFDRSICQGYTSAGIPVSAGIEDPTPCGLVLCRPADSTWTYAEMTSAHRATLQGVKRSIGSSLPTRHCSSFRVFNGTLEKGVTRRMRVRGLFLPRAEDEAQAAQHFNRFLKIPPQLDT